MRRNRGKKVIYKPKRDLEQIMPSLSSGGTQPANNLTLNLQPPESQDDTFLLLKPPSLWHFVMATLTN